jgi:hypothetical protein
MNKNVISEIQTQEITEIERSALVEIADYEIEHFLVTTVPRYQSCSDMHIKYSSNKPFKKVINTFQLYVDSLYENLKIISAWFNVCKEDSSGWAWHDHLVGSVDIYNRSLKDERDCDLVLNYFLKNTDNNGTWFKTSDGKEVQIGGKENSILLFDPSLVHKTPFYTGSTRYTLTCEYSRNIK